MKNTKIKNKNENKNEIEKDPESEDRMRDEILEELKMQNDVEAAFDFGYLTGSTVSSQAPEFGKMLWMLFKACIAMLLVGEDEEKIVKELAALDKEEKMERYMMYGGWNSRCC